MNKSLNYLITSRENINTDINSIIKKTYMLLSVNILFSSIFAFLSIYLKFSGFNPFFIVIFYFVIFYFISQSKNILLNLLLLFFFTGCLGFSSGPILNKYLALNNGKELILISLVSTGLNFSILSLYVIFKKKNFDFLSGFLFVGLSVTIFFTILNIFFKLPLLSIVLSSVLIILFSMYILYDTSKIVNGGENNYIIVTLSLYLNIYNIFFSILNILNFFSSKE